MADGAAEGRGKRARDEDCSGEGAAASSSSSSWTTSSSSSSPSSSSSSSAAATDPAVELLLGSCGWTDDTLLRCKRFYPASSRSAVERLRHYSRYFPTVEVDTSNYAIPRASQAAEWAATVPEGFAFHAKAFGLFTTRSVAPNAMPRDLREEFALPAHLEAAASVRLSQLPDGLVDALWARQNEFLGALGCKMGVVVFQFFADFTPTPANLAYLAECRARLGRGRLMAVEFRSRLWYSLRAPTATLATTTLAATEGATPSSSAPSSSAPSAFATQRAATLAALRDLDVISVASDDLACEFGDSAQPTLPDGRVLVADDLTSPRAAVVRLHRRRGEHRLLSASELDEWAARLHRMASCGDASYATAFPELQAERCAPASGYSSRPAAGPLVRLRGPVYFLFGTDWEDQPMRNMRALAARVAAPRPGAGLRVAVPDWRARARELDVARGGLGAFFKPRAAAADGAAEAAAPGDDDVVVVLSETAASPRPRPEGAAKKKGLLAYFSGGSGGAVS